MFALKRSLRLLSSRSLSKKVGARYVSSSASGMTVYSWGTGDEGQLGHPEIKKSGITNTYVETSPGSIAALEGVGIVDVACGFTHAAAVTSSGQVLTWGSNEYSKLGSGPGALGHGDNETRAAPTKVNFAGGADVKLETISSGKTHMLGLGIDGEVWSWGKGEFGRLGNGGNEDQLEPEPVEFFLDTDTVITQIACGDSFCLALSDEGQIYGWGKNEQSQLGIGGGLSMDVYAMENFPQLVEELADEKVVHIAAGAHHSMAINDEGELYFWGMRLWLEPHKMTILRDQRIVQAACGNNFSFALSDAGQVFSWCKGLMVRKSGVLGLGHTNSTQQPELIHELANTSIQKVVAGNKFALAISGLPG